MHNERTNDAARECTGFKRPVPLSNRLYPVTLYHVSVNKESVCKEGIKAVAEIKPLKLVQGVGGYQYDSVSFSYDDTFIRGYAKDMLLLARIVDGKVTARNIEDYLDKNDSSSKMRIKPSTLFKKICDGKMGDRQISVTAYRKAEPRVSPYAREIRSVRSRHAERRSRPEEPEDTFEWYRNEYTVVAYPGMLEDLKAGRIFDRRNIGYYLRKLPRDECIQFLKKQAGHVWWGSDHEIDNVIRVGNKGDFSRDTGKDLTVGKDDAEICDNITEHDVPFTYVDEIFPDDYRKLEPVELRSILFGLILRFYFEHRQKKGGRQDPYFFRVGFLDYLRIKPGNIGLFKVLAYMPKPLESYIEDPYFKEHGNIEDEYPESLEEGAKKEKWEHHKNKVMIARYEREVRIPPKYTTMLEEIPI